MTLTYAIEETAPYSRAAVMACVAKACEQWSKALAGRVRFQLMAHDDDEEEADITFRFGRIDNEAWIAQHRRWAAASVITFRDSYTSGKPHSWAINGWARFWSLKDSCLLTCALHEIGHALGFTGHVAPGAGCMEANQNHRWTKPTPVDVAAVLPALQKLYPIG
jgi:predicted Zn-dependent protease